MTYCNVHVNLGPVSYTRQYLKLLLNFEIQGSDISKLREILEIKTFKVLLYLFIHMNECVLPFRTQNQTISNNGR